MKCNSCGAENADGTRFCVTCGAELAPAEAQAQPQSAPADATPVESVYSAPAAAPEAKKKGDAKKIIIIAAIAVIAVLLIVVLCTALKPSKYIEAKTAINFFFSDGEDKTTIVVNGKPLKKTIDGEVSTLGGSADGSVRVVVASTGEDDNVSYVAYYVTKSGAKEIVKEDIDNVSVSRNGKGVIYTVEEEDECTLYYYSGGKPKEIKSGLSYASGKLSPDGKTVAFIYKNADSEGSEAKAAAYKGGKIKDLKDDISIEGLSNGGKNIYYTKTVDGTEKLYCVSYGKSNEKSIGTVNGNITFNYDYTQVLFQSGDNGTTYISVKGKEKKEFFGKSDVDIITPNGCLGIVKDFYNQVYSVSDSRIYYIYKGGSGNTKLAGSSYGMLTEDGKTLFFSDSGEIKSVAVKKNTTAKEVIDVGSNYEGFYASPDGKYVYYGDGGDVRVVKANGKGDKSLKDDASLAGVYKNKIYILAGDDDDELYVAEGGKLKKKAIGTDVSAVSGTVNGTFYKTNADDAGAFDVYYSSNGTKFKKILSDVQ